MSAPAVVFACGMVDQAHAETADHIEHAITALFVAEVMVKVAARRLAYFRQPWGVFDAAVIAVALLPLLPVGVGLARLARVAHVLRHLSQLRLARAQAGARPQVGPQVRPPRQAQRRPGGA